MIFWVRMLLLTTTWTLVLQVGQHSRTMMATTPCDITTTTNPFQKFEGFESCCVVDPKWLCILLFTMLRV